MKRNLKTDTAPYSMNGVIEFDGVAVRLPMYDGTLLSEAPIPAPNYATAAGIFFAGGGMNDDQMYCLTNETLSVAFEVPWEDVVERIIEIPSGDENVIFYRTEGAHNATTENCIYRYYFPADEGKKLLDLNSEAFRNILTAYQGVVTHWQAINNRELIFVIEPMADVPEDSDAYRAFLEQERERLKDNEKARQLLDAMLHGDGEVVYRPMIVYDTETQEMKTLYTQGEQKTYIESVSNILWNPVQE